MYKLIIFCIAVIALISCDNSRNRRGKPIVKTVDETSVIDSHNARDSLSFYGVYEGVFPCADCEGIKTTVILYKDGNYKMEIGYIKTGESHDSFTLKGGFMWDDGGQIISLVGAREKNFFVAEGRLIAVDEDGNEIDSTLSDRYILRQIEVFE